MSDDAANESQVVQDIFGSWLNATQLHGCAFAALAAREGRILSGSYFDLPDENTIVELSTHVRVAASQSQLALAVFPSIATERELADLVHLLKRCAGWSVQRLDVVGRFAVEIRWTPTGGMEASAIGFAPLGTMPVTRRAPYVAIAVWSRGHENPRRSKPGDFVGIGDMPHNLDEAAYDAMFRATRERVSRSRDVLGDVVSNEITFCLSESSGPLKD